MSASANVLQLVRSHYAGDEAAFKSAATTLARNAKLPQAKTAIFEAIRMGANRPSRPLRPLQPPNIHPEADGMLMPLEPTTFADLLLEDGLQSMLDELVVELEYRGELAARNLRPRSRLLLHGPPGNGKSACGAAIASALQAEGFVVYLPELCSKFVNATGENLGKLFRSMRPNRVVVFDELDAVGTQRGNDSSGAQTERNAIVNTLLTLLDRRTPGVIVATTNRPDIIDPALRRRFDEEIYFPEPTPEQMRVLAARRCADHGVDPPYVDDCRNFDEVTKRCMTHARRLVMAEILKLEEDSGEEENQDG